MNIHHLLEECCHSLTQEYHARKSLLSFPEYLSELSRNPLGHIRTVSHYLRDCFFYLQTTNNHASPADFFHTEWESEGAVFGHQPVLESLIRVIDGNFREGTPQRLILLHGPNGSGKTSIVKKLMQALEVYSRTDEGALYTFNWVFPSPETERSRFGLSGTPPLPEQDWDSFARLPAELIQSTLRSELREAPYLLLPKEFRQKFFQALLHDASGDLRKNLECRRQSFLNESPSLRNQMIFDSLLNAYEGDLMRVLKHVQVERFTLNREILSGLITIDPMMHTDMNLRQVTAEQSYQLLPSHLKSLNMYAMEGDVIKGNRGVIEYNDILKRPIESFKYLLTTCETGSLRVGPITVRLDSLLIGSCNEKQLDAFKEYPDFGSFKARMTLIRVPLITDYRQEERIYEPLVSRLSAQKPFFPGTSRWLALWAVMTRLRKPFTQNLSEKFRSEVSRLTCLQKAYVYAQEKQSLPFSAWDDHSFATLVKELVNQYRFQASYEGRWGASPREMKNIILCAFKRYETLQSVTLQAITEELEEFADRVSEFDFLKQESVDSYQNPKLYIQWIKDIALAEAERAFQEASGIVDIHQIESSLTKYVLHVTHEIRHEKLRNVHTGQLEAPDEAYIYDMEKRMGVEGNREFREQVMNRIAVDYLENQQKPDFVSLFPELINSLRNSFFRDKKPLLLNRVHQLLQPHDPNIESQDRKLANQTRHILQEKFGYFHECLDEVLRGLSQKFQ
jgi:predicted Ser/Thr protein kinase